MKGYELKELRNNLRLKQIEFAKKTGLSTNAISSNERKEKGQCCAEREKGGRGRKEVKRQGEKEY